MQAEKGALKFAFRKAAARDLPDISRIYDESFAKFVDTRHTHGYFSDALRNERDHELVVATDQNGGVAGFLLLGAQNSFMPKGLNVDVVAVDEKFRGQGLGRALMKQAEQIGLRHDFNVMTLQVHEENTGAIGLYESMGYGSAGRAKRYYRDGKDALGMFKLLGAPPALGYPRAETQPARSYA
jgi:ribosomal protein S18 acetylase RimI-like enzyme